MSSFCTVLSAAKEGERLTSYLHAIVLPITIESVLSEENFEWQVEEGMFMVTNTQSLHYLVIH